MVKRLRIKFLRSGEAGKRWKNNSRHDWSCKQIYNFQCFSWLVEDVDYCDKIVHSFCPLKHISFIFSSYGILLDLNHVVFVVMISRGFFFFLEEKIIFPGYLIQCIGGPVSLCSILNVSEYRSLLILTHSGGQYASMVLCQRISFLQALLILPVLCSSLLLGLMFSFFHQVVQNIYLLENKHNLSSLLWAEEVVLSFGRFFQLLS